MHGNVILRKDVAPGGGDGGKGGGGQKEGGNGAGAQEGNLPMDPPGVPCIIYAIIYGKVWYIDAIL